MKKISIGIQKENHNITMALLEPKSIKEVSIKVDESDYIYLKELSDRSGATIPALIKQMIRRMRLEFEV